MAMQWHVATWALHCQDAKTACNAMLTCSSETPMRHAECTQDAILNCQMSSIRNYKSCACRRFMNAAIDESKIFGTILIGYQDVSLSAISPSYCLRDVSRTATLMVHGCAYAQPVAFNASSDTSSGLQQGSIEDSRPWRWVPNGQGAAHEAHLCTWTDPR